MASPSFFSDGSTPRVTDTRWQILQKILGATIDAGGGTGTATDYNLIGDNDPVTPPADQLKVWTYKSRNTGRGWTWDPSIATWI